MVKEITLAQALCGFNFPVEHLDKRILNVKSNPGEIIKPNDLKLIQAEGMPIHRRPYEKGRLIHPLQGQIS